MLVGPLRSEASVPGEGCLGCLGEVKRLYLQRGAKIVGWGLIIGLRHFAPSPVA